MNIHSSPVLTYRWIVFSLAGGYCLYQVMTSNYAHFGGPFRYLTIWALFLSFYSASRMLALSHSRTARAHEVTAMIAATLNIMVCYLYWKLWFTDPKLVGNGGPVIWHQEYYLHALGPALQIIDATFIGRVYRRTWRAALPLLAVIAAYVAWSELVLQRLNDTPSGIVTSGLPYPFLNSLELAERGVFYGFNAGVALALLAVFALVGLVLRHNRQRL